MAQTVVQRRKTIRIAAAFAVLWTIGYLIYYFTVIGKQAEGGPADVAKYYVVMLCLASVMLLVCLAKPNQNYIALFGAGLLAVCVVLGLRTIGFWLIPAFLAALVAVDASNKGVQSARREDR